MGFTVPAIQTVLFWGEVGRFLQSLSSGIPSLLLQSNAVFKISPRGTSPGDPVLENLPSSAVDLG